MLNTFMMMEEDKTTSNILECNIVAGFKCEKCGIEIIDYTRRKINEDTGEEIHLEYTPKFCPSCGRKIINKKKIIEIDCRKCKNFGDYECNLYGKNPYEAIEKCGNARFKNYVEVKE